MSSEGSVTRWVDALQAGDTAAAQRLWVFYFRRLVGLARKKLQREGLLPMKPRVVPGAAGAGRGGPPRSPRF